jgi:hypothetical protein
LSHLDERFEKDERLEQLSFLDLKVIREIPRTELEDYGVRQIRERTKKLGKVYLKENGQPLFDGISILQE